MTQALTQEAQQLRTRVAQLLREAQTRVVEITKLKKEAKDLAAVVAEQRFTFVATPRIRKLLDRIAVLYNEVGGGLDALLALSRTQAELVEFITVDLETPLSGLEDVPELSASIAALREASVGALPTQKASALKKKIVEQVLRLVKAYDAAVGQFVSKMEESAPGLLADPSRDPSREPSREPSETSRGSATEPSREL